MTDRELMQQALDALEYSVPSGYGPTELYDDAIEALRTRLGQPEQKPWGYISHKSWKMPVFIEADDLQAANLPFNNPDYTPVYKAPLQREWQGLTDEEINALHYELKCAAMGATSTLGMYRILEKALKEKNNG